MEKVDIKLIQCSDGNDFAEEFGRVIREGYTVHSSGMSGARARGANWTNEQWWAICSKVSNVKS